MPASLATGPARSSPGTRGPHYTASAKGAIGQWINSPGHKAILLCTDYNYVAFGLAISPDSGRRYWAGVFIKGPDRTGAWSQAVRPRQGGLQLHADPGHVPLDRRRHEAAGPHVRTLRYFEIQRRADGGDWASYGATKATSLTTTWARGNTYEFRVRAVDWAGNWGGWRTVTVTL